MKTYVIIAVGVAYFIELLKNFLPAKVKENNKAMAAISIVISAVGAIGYQFINRTIDPNVVITWQSLLVNTGLVVALTQGSYNTLVQIGKAVKEKLSAKSTIDAEKTADEIADKIVDTVTSSLTEQKG